MKLERVSPGLFVIPALTSNVGFFVGDIGNPDYHDEWYPAVTLVVNANWGLC